MDTMDAIIVPIIKTGQRHIRSLRLHSPRLIEGLRLLLGYLPKELDEYREYSGIKYILLRSESGLLIRSFMVDEICPQPNLRPTYSSYRRYSYVCSGPEDFEIEVDPDIEIIYWNPETKKMRARNV